MGNNSFTFKGANGQDIFCRFWGVSEKPKGIVQIFHGLAEHSGRYADFAAYLNSLGFAVYACDERGHGKTGELNQNLCDLDGDGFHGIVRDQQILSKLIREKHPGTPLFIFAHSFGSFIAQEYIKQYGTEVDGLVLSGSCRMGGVVMAAGFVVAAMSLVFGRKRPNKLANQLSFGSYNKRIPNPAGKFDWLSCDKEQVKKYEEDPFCGFIVSCNFFFYMTKGLMLLNRKTGSIPKELPVYLIAGAEDPVGEYGEGVKQLYDGYKVLGIKDLQMKIYPGCRHEIINELNREEVLRDVSAWLQKHCGNVEAEQA